MLSNRLIQVAKYVLPGSVVVDVGTDHAHLPIHLLNNKLASQIIGIEINEGPYQKALENIKLKNLNDHIEILKGNGLKPVLNRKVDVVVIAGIGGHNIVDILKEGKDLLKNIKRLILQPMTASDLVRSYLCNHKDLTITDEDLVLEDERVYEIIIAEPGQGEDFDDIIIEIGPMLLKKRHPLLPILLENKIEKYRKISEELENSSKLYAKEKKKYYEAKVNCLEKVMISCL